MRASLNEQTAPTATPVAVTSRVARTFAREQIHALLLLRNRKCRLPWNVERKGLHAVK